MEPRLYWQTTIFWRPFVKRFALWSCKVWLTSVERHWCSTKPRRETRWNLPVCPKLANRSQPLVGRSSPYYEDVWKRYCCLIFFRLSIYALVAKIQPDKFVWWCADGDFWRFFRPVFSVSRMQHISDLQYKFALRPHHMWKYGRHPISEYGRRPISDRWEYQENQESTTAAKYNGLPITMGCHD